LRVERHGAGKGIDFAAEQAGKGEIYRQQGGRQALACQERHAKRNK